jgi:hypothetical protein
MVDRGIKFQSNIIILINKHNIQIQLANSKKSISITEKYNYTLQE